MKYLLLISIFLIGCASTTEEDCQLDDPPRWCSIDLYRDQKNK